jgi:microcin C transport system substrate-binding protein
MIAADYFSHTLPRLPMRSVFPSLCCALALALALSPQALAAHALTVYGEAAKYPAGFEHFDYVNPTAPKGGSFRRAAMDIGQFDHLMPFIDKGIGVSQIEGLVYAPLAVRSLDEPYTVYGLVARSLTLSEDGLSLRLELDPRARFADGVPITAEDVRFTFDLLMTQGSLRYRAQFADVAQVVVEGERQVRFDFKNRDTRTLPLDVAMLPVFAQHWWKGRDFANGGGFEPPLGSGPYRIGKVDNGRSVTFERNPHWWGKDLPVAQGMYNFDRVTVEYFGDIEVARQVLRGGGFDYNREFSATAYTIGYAGPALDDGRLQRAHLAPKGLQTAQGYVFNLARPQFQDRRVREALAMLWDFEWSNRQLMRNLYLRQQSFFSNSPLAATEPPSPAELKILGPLRDQLPKEVFGPAFRAPTTDGSGNIRDKQLRALQLLAEAGWHPNGDRLVNAQGESLSFTFLNAQSSLERLLLPYKRNLAQIGIDLQIRRIDPSQYLNRLMARDYDMIVAGYPVSASPGLELYNYFGSTAATDSGSGNYMVLRNPAVDSLIEGVVKAGNYDDMVNHAHALDRVLQWNHYWIPNYYPPGTSTVWWNRFGIPAVQAAYEEAPDTWWEISPSALTTEQMAKRSAEGGRP